MRSGEAEREKNRRKNPSLSQQLTWLAINRAHPHIAHNVGVGQLFEEAGLVGQVGDTQLGSRPQFLDRHPHDGAVAGGGVVRDFDCGVCVWCVGGRG